MDLVLRKVSKGDKIGIYPGVKQRLYRIFLSIYKQIDSSKNWKGARILRMLQDHELRGE
jgi:hypothetical protein